jgi:serine/threonine protein kinase
MDGGSIIGKGAYGCVFDPPLACQTRQNKTMKKGHRVGKLSRMKDITNEIRTSNLLYDVPNAENMYVLVDKNSLCHPAPIEKQSKKDKKDIEECDAYKQWGMSDMYHYTMKFGGITIKKFEKRVLDKSPEDFPIYTFAKCLLTACSHFLLKGIIHSDLHKGNILINPKTQMPMIIDFGLSFFKDDIQKPDFIDNMWTSYSPHLNQEPPEYSYMIGVHNKMKSNDIIIDIVEQKHSVASMASVFRVMQANQMKQFVSFVNSSSIIKNRDWRKLMETYWPVSDSWAVGGVLIYFYKACMLFSKNTKSEFYKHKSTLKSVIKALLSINPDKRVDCLEALSMLDPNNSLVSSSESVEWLMTRAKRHLV